MPLRESDFVGPAKRLDDVDLPRIGREIGVGEDELHAVMDVEAAGSPSDNRGRLKMLFEPHVFYRNLRGEERARAVREGLAYPDWRRGYPADSYPRLMAAMAINETAALRSASWGRSQILGENHKMAGYATPQEMVLDFAKDEDNHIEAMVRFIKSAKIDDELRAHDWAGFARGYNGASYAQHGYHTKLAAAYDKWRKIKDTPLPAGGAVAKGATTGGIAAGTVAAAGAVAKRPEVEGGGFDFALLVPILVVGLSAAAVAWFVWPSAKKETAK